MLLLLFVTLREGVPMAQYYYVTEHGAHATFKADQHFLSAEEAISAAKKLPHASICCDARNLVTYEKGKLTVRSGWEQFYTGEPSPEWKALELAVLNDQRYDHHQGVCHCDSWDTCDAY
jgi:hypothetical protein